MMSETVSCPGPTMPNSRQKSELFTFSPPTAILWSVATVIFSQNVWGGCCCCCCRRRRCCCCRRRRRRYAQVAACWVLRDTLSERNAITYHINRTGGKLYCHIVFPACMSGKISRFCRLPRRSRRLPLQLLFACCGLRSEVVFLLLWLNDLMDGATLCYCVLFLARRACVSVRI